MEGVLKVEIAGEVYPRARAALAGRGPWVIEGTIEAEPEGEEVRLKAEGIWLVENG
jgi:hypothetical protein